MGISESFVLRIAVAPVYVVVSPGERTVIAETAEAFLVYLHRRLVHVFAVLFLVLLFVADVVIFLIVLEIPESCIL